MVLSLVALVIGTQAAAQAPTQATAKPSTPGKLISLAMQHYYEAKSLSGKIRLVQKAQGVALTFETDVAIDRPSKFLIRQTKVGSQSRWLAVSDGKYFSYDLPLSALGPQRTREYVTQHGVTQTINEMFPAAAKGLGERSPLLDLVFARNVDLDDFRKHFQNLRFAGTEQIRGSEANLIEGDYCELVGQEPTGVCQLAITDSGDFLRYIAKTRYAVPNHPGEIVEVTSTWDADIKVGTPNPDSVYAVRG